MEKHLINNIFLNAILVFDSGHKCHFGFWYCVSRSFWFLIVCTMVLEKTSSEFLSYTNFNNFISWNWQNLHNQWKCSNYPIQLNWMKSNPKWHSQVYSYSLTLYILVDRQNQKLNRQFTEIHFGIKMCVYFMVNWRLCGVQIRTKMHKICSRGLGEISRVFWPRVI